MAEHGRELETQALHDGRFGDGFDDEIGVGGLGKIALGLALACVIAIVIVWLMLDIGSEAGVRVGAPTAVDEATQPEPRLQANPEGEYEQMRHELDAHVNGYGWIDEGTGVVYIPIDQAIDLVLEQGVDGRAKELLEDVPAEEPQ